MSGFFRVVALTGVFSLLIGCGPNDGDGDGPDVMGEPGSLVIVPGDVTLTIDNGTAATQLYEAAYIDENGDSHDVTDETEFSINFPILGTFAGNQLTTAADRAGRAQITGRYQAKNATATSDLTIILNHVIVEPGAPDNAPDLFDGAGTGGNDPSLVYPSPGIMVPPNMNTLEVQFLPGAGNDLFELAYTGELVTLQIYLTCNPLAEGCVYEPSESTWELLATAGRGEQPLFWSIRGLTQASPSAAGVSETHSMQFSSDDMLGGIYYWNAGAGSIMRYEFGRRGQSAERYLSVAQTGGTQCVGCHVLNRAGDRIAVGLDIPGPAAMETYQVADRQMLWREGGSVPGSGGANFAAFSDDGTQILTSDGATILLRDAETGAGGAEVIGSGTMPDWAPDGSQVVFARPSQTVPCPIPGACASPGIGSGNIITTVPGNWGAEQMLVPSQNDNNYYPAYSPDSDWIVFNKSHGSDSFDAPDAEVWAVSSSGGAAIRMSQASPNGDGDSWPKWAPHSHTYSDGQVMWVTFSSKRDYGLRLKNSAASEKRAQIWMAAFDPSRAAAGQDGSFTAFWLPFQELESGNHIAQWVEEVDRQDCEPGGCPSGEFCEGGTCYPEID